MASFKETPLHLAEQWKTILSLVVNLLILTIGKCGRYHISADEASVSGTLRKYPFSTNVSIIFWYYFSTNPFFFRFLSELRRLDSAIYWLLVSWGFCFFLMEPQHCIFHCCTKQSCWLFLRPLSLFQRTQFVTLNLTEPLKGLIQFTTASCSREVQCKSTRANPNETPVYPPYHGYQQKSYVSHHYQHLSVSPPSHPSLVMQNHTGQGEATCLCLLLSFGLGSFLSQCGDKSSLRSPL